MESELVHHGNNNFKRYRATCGNLKQRNDSTSPNEVTCKNCIEILLRRADANKYRTSKTPMWERRLKQLMEQNQKYVPVTAQNELFVYVRKDHSAATNIPDKIVFTKEQIDAYISFREEFDRKTNEQHHKEACERWNTV